MTSQPKWKCIAQLDDINPIDHGGYWILLDTTGEYSPEGEVLIEQCDHTYLAYRFLLDKCTHVNGILSDNPYHPDHPAWYADDLRSISSSAGYNHMGELVEDLCSDNPINLAIAYRAIGEYYGYDNLDHDPLVLTRSEARKRYSRAMYKIK